MQRSIPASLGVLSGVAALVWLTAVQLDGQAPSSGPRAAAARAGWKAPRTVDGQPDLQGVWANNSVTPLERPEALAGKEVLTDAEVADLQKKAADILSGKQAGDIIGDRLLQEALKDPNLRPFDAVTGNYNTFWIVDRDWDNRTSLIMDPPDGKIPPTTPEARKRAADRAAARKGRGPMDSHEDRPLSERCITFGMPDLLAGYNSYYHIVQTTGYVAIATERIHDVRLIPLDGRPHPPESVRLWNGDSRGRWEGDTLVVETTNFSERGVFRGASESLRVTERFSRAADDVLAYEMTFNDPKTWTKPWTVLLRLRRSEDKVYEYACHEGNHSMVGVLAGARVEESAAAKTKK
jgi:hypothetical protein